MNLVGKIFVVLIFVMSLVVMGFLMAVYSAHTNWRNVVMNPETGLKVQLDKAKSDNQELNARVKKLSESLATEEAEARQALAKLATQVDELTTRRDAEAQKLIRLEQDQREAVAAMQASQDSLKDLRGEVDTLRADIVKSKQDRDDQFAQVVKLTDDLHQAVNMQRTLKQRNDELAADHAKALEVLRKFDLKAEPASYVGVAPKVPGQITAVREGGLVEISIGSDDGLMKGHTLEVYRIGGGVSTYLGRIEVIDTLPDKAVARILPELQKGSMQAGDRVTSRFK